MIPEHKITQIYFIVDEFFKEFDNTIKEYSLGNVKTGKRNRKFTMSESEVMTILPLFHLGAAFKNLKAFYVFYPKAYGEGIPMDSLLQPVCGTPAEGWRAYDRLCQDDVPCRVHRNILHRLHPLRACHIKPHMLQKIFPYRIKTVNQPQCWRKRLHGMRHVGWYCEHVSFLQLFFLFANKHETFALRHIRNLFGFVPMGRVGLRHRAV
jgi:hypothetical protein